FISSWARPPPRPTLFPYTTLFRSLPDVYADRVMVEQVLLNLVKNAIEAMRETPPGERALRVDGRVNLDGDVEVRVVDRGSGLSQDRKSTRLNSSHVKISYAVFCLK